MKSMMTLLECNVSVNAVDYDRRPALHLAVSNGRMKVVQFLLASNADHLAQDRWGRNAMDCAEQGGHDIVQYLLRASENLLSSGQNESKPKRPREDSGKCLPSQSVRSISMSGLSCANSKPATQQYIWQKNHQPTSCMAGGTADLLDLSDRLSKTARYFTATGIAGSCWSVPGHSPSAHMQNAQAATKLHPFPSYAAAGQQEAETAKPARPDSKGPELTGLGCPAHDATCDASPGGGRCSSTRWDIDSEGWVCSANAGIAAAQPPWRCVPRAEGCLRGAAPVDEAGSRRAAAEDEHLARVQYIFTHGADIAGPPGRPVSGAGPLGGSDGSDQPISSRPGPGKRDSDTSSGGGCGRDALDELAGEEWRPAAAGGSRQAVCGGGSGATDRRKLARSSSMVRSLRARAPLSTCQPPLGASPGASLVLMPASSSFPLGVVSRGCADRYLCRGLRRCCRRWWRGRRRWSSSTSRASPPAAPR